MIRRFQEPDLQITADIWLDTNIRTHDFIPAQYWYSHLEAVKGMFLQAELYVYEEEGGIQGFAGLYDAYLAGIFVRGAAQSRGIGRQLLEFLKDRKRELSLCVYQKNIRAIQFYQREGFVLQKEQIDPDTGEKEYSMRWEGPRCGKQQEQNTPMGFSQKIYKHPIN